MVDFSNTKVAFNTKNNSELKRAYFLFKLISNKPLVKIGTALTNFALKTNLPIDGLVKSTVFDHFCGGISIIDCKPKINKMYKSNVYCVLDYSVEGKQTESQFDLITKKTLDLLDFAADNKSIPFTVFKPTAVGCFEIYKKISQSENLNNDEFDKWNRIKDRFHSICRYAQKKNIPVLIDAEESWIQKAVDNLTEELMKVYNKDKVIIFNTLQAYRWDRYQYLIDLHKNAKIIGFKIGIKLVRGAYMEKERTRAQIKGYKSPICQTKVETDKNFNKCLIYIINNLDDINLFLGTHNEASTLKAVRLLNSIGVKNNNTKIWFGQLYGMSDHISFNLAENDFNVSKYLPYGPVKDVMPYLIRRAEENTSVSGHTSRELELIKTEKNRRGI